MPTITLSNLTKRYGAGTTTAVNDISLTVEDGSFTCILGPSGCGKSTILRMIAGLESVSGGEISVDGLLFDSVAKGAFVPPEKREIGLVFQSYALWPHMTVAQNIEFGLKIKKMPAAARRARVAQMVETLRIEGLEDRYPAQLSGGQQQRVALARTLAVTPGILLLDEPLSNLDAALRLSMRAELSRLHREFGTTIVFVTHDQWEAMTLATDIAVMSRGKLQHYASPDEIYSAPANRFVADFIGNPPINMIAATSTVARSFAQAASLNVRDAHEVGLRPEGIFLGLSETQDAVPAVVESILPTGGSWLVEAKCADDDGPIRLIQSTQTPPHWQVGQAVFVTAAPEALHLFSDTGTRIASGVRPVPSHSRDAAGVA